MIIMHIILCTLIVQILNDDHNSSVHFISQINLKIKTKDITVSLIYKQFFVYLCFIIIINKFQNQML